MLACENFSAVTVLFEVVRRAFGIQYRERVSLEFIQTLIPYWYDRFE